MQTRNLKTILRDEAEALNAFAAGQKLLQELISTRQWNRLEGQVQELRRLASRAEALEDRRFCSYEELKAALAAAGEQHETPSRGETCTFETVVTCLPAAERDELLALHRQLKLAVIRVKSNAALLGTYLRSLSETLQKVLEELFPHRKGRIYSRSGKTRDTAGESLVLYGHV